MRKKIEYDITPAKGKTGFLLRSAFGGGPAYFRIYDPTRKGNFTDYEIAHHDLEIKIVDKSACLYKSVRKSLLDYSPEVLGETNVVTRNRKSKIKKK